MFENHAFRFKNVINPRCSLNTARINTISTTLAFQPIKISYNDYLPSISEFLVISNALKAKGGLFPFSGGL